jgi:hypothetical protein
MGTEREQIRKSRLSVLAIEAKCVISTLGLMLRHKLEMPNYRVGSNVRFADGSVSTIFRETAMRGLVTTPEVMLAVRFRLRFIGSSRLGHWLFRLESVLNTLLFAAHRGFHTKLWLTDPRTNFYRGIYEWADETSALEYAETLRVVLAPWVQAGTFDYRILPGVNRLEFLEVGVPDCLGEDPHGCWWLPVRHAANAVPTRSRYP